MSKELEALQDLSKLVFIHGGIEQYKIIETALKALEIIKEKPVVALVDYKYTYQEWLELVDEREKDLFRNQEEYDLLKGVLL